MRLAIPALLAIAALTGCGTASSGPAAAAPAATTPPASCHQLYETWKHGPATAGISAFKSAIGRVQAQGNADDLPGITAALRRAGRAARQLAAVPPPRCADPAGDYPAMLALVKASGDNARSAHGLGGIILAEAPLKRVPAAEKKLNAELDRTVGKSR